MTPAKRFWRFVDPSTRWAPRTPSKDGFEAGTCNIITLWTFIGRMLQLQHVSQLALVNWNIAKRQAQYQNQQLPSYRFCRDSAQLKIHLKKRWNPLMYKQPTICASRPSTPQCMFLLAGPNASTHPNHVQPGRRRKQDGGPNFFKQRLMLSPLQYKRLKVAHKQTHRMFEVLNHRFLIAFTPHPRWHPVRCTTFETGNAYALPGFTM